MPKIRYGATQRRQRQLTRGPLRPRFQPRQVVLARTINRRPTFIPRPRMTNVRFGGYIDREVKFFDTTYTAAFIANTGWAGSELETATYGLFCPQQGDGESGRDGRKVLVKSLHLKGCLYKAKAADQDDPDDPVQVTFMVVQDMQTNGAQAQGETIMDDTPAATEECFSFRNLEYTKRFRVLFKKTYVLRDAMAFSDGANTGATSGTGVLININRMLNVPVEFSASTGAVTDIVDNSFHVYACCTVGNTVKLKYNSRVRFVG